MVAPQAAPLINGAPHYFSHPNYANSPLPSVTTNPGAAAYVGNVLQDRAYASDYPVAVGQLAPVFVVVPAALPAGLLQSFQTWNQATAGGSPFPSAGNVFHAYVLRPTGNPNEYTVVFDSGLLTVPALTTAGTSEAVAFGVASLAVQAGDRLAFYGQGIPVDTGAGTDVIHYPAVQPLQDTNITLGSAAYPVLAQPRTYSFGAQVLTPDVVTVSGGIRKFVDGLPGLNAANNLGQMHLSRQRGHGHLRRRRLLRDRGGAVPGENALGSATDAAARLRAAQGLHRAGSHPAVSTRC